MAGIMMTVFGAGTLIGGPLAGWLSDHHGWEWSFWIQVSINGSNYLPKTRKEETKDG